MEGQSNLGFWDVVARYPFGTLVIALSTIWAVERVTKALIKPSHTRVHDNPAGEFDKTVTFEE